jgi:hypothetical protein
MNKTIKELIDELRKIIIEDNYLTNLEIYLGKDDKITVGVENFMYNHYSSMQNKIKVHPSTQDTFFSYIENDFDVTLYEIHSLEFPKINKFKEKFDFSKLQIIIKKLKELKTLILRYMILNKIKFNNLKEVGWVDIWSTNHNGSGIYLYDKYSQEALNKVKHFELNKIDNWLEHIF